MIVTLDFETEAIEGRPKYPPRPVGLAYKEDGRPGKYLAWGHASENNCTKTQVADRLRDYYRGGHDLLFHNSKFDLDVAEAHFGLKLPPWHKVHDTMFLLFLLEPHSPDLKLKPSAERVLGWPPDEQEELKDWILKHVKEATEKEWGAHIAKAPGKLAGKYAVGDVDRTKALFKKLHKALDPKMLVAYDRERKLMPILLDTERHGLRVDLPGIRKAVKSADAAMLKADTWLRKKLRAPGLNLNADQDVADALMRSKQVKSLPKTAKGNDSVSKKNLTMDFFKDPMVWRALYYRNALETCLSMSMRPWAEQAENNNGRIYTEWNQVRQSSNGPNGFKGARSGRITASRFQNITKDFLDRGDDYGPVGDSAVRESLGLPPLPLVRTFILPDEGDHFVHRDYNQQEMRLVAHYEDGALALAYRTDPAMDVHTFVQALILQVVGRHYERRPVKIVDFRTVYGSGAPGLARGLKWPLEEAKELIGAWRTSLPDVVALDKELRSRFENGLHIRTWGGRVYYCKPPVLDEDTGRLKTFAYTALNYLIQPSGADVTKQAMIDFHDHPKKRSRLLLAVHDELNLSAAMKLAKAQSEVLRECMEAQKINVPWRTDGKIGSTWGTVK